MSKSRTARYMMIRYGRGNEYDRSEYRRDGVRTEGGNYARDDYGVDNRFRDRRGREHYDNGRYAPRSEYGDMGGDYSGVYSRGNSPNREYGDENRRSREGEIRNNYDGGGRMNVIGFDRPQEMQSHYPMRIDYTHGNEMEHRTGSRNVGGAMGAEMVMTPEIAKEWVKGMHNEDGTTGEHWTMEQVKKLMTQKGIEYDAAQVYAIINAMYSDYCKVFKKYGLSAPEFYLDLAVAFLNDRDAKPNKAMNYYECIVK